MKKEISKQAYDTILLMQKNEITEYHIYRKIAERLKDEKNKKILLGIANEEKRHYGIWATYTGTEVKPDQFKVFVLTFLARVLGFTFIIKKMENGEQIAQTTYQQLLDEIPEATVIQNEEHEHENALIEMMDEERLQYVGSMVLGLNDALVELTGTLAGLTLALQSTKLVALSGLITGISATLSMASSEYLSARSEGDENAIKSSIYTGIAYLFTVIAMVTPYLIFSDENFLLALFSLIIVVILIIVVFNYYISVAKGLNFKKRVVEMLSISLGVALLSFVIGLAVKHFLGIDI